MWYCGGVALFYISSLLSYETCHFSDQFLIVSIKVAQWYNVQECDANEAGLKNRSLVNDILSYYAAYLISCISTSFL